MIASLRGIVEALGPDFVVVRVGGVGFRVSAPTRTLTALGGLGEEVKLQTHLVVREDELSLYGFATHDELRLFTLLTNITGVGPRHALRLLSVMAPDELAGAIVNEDVSALTRAPGVGRKTAARISLELKQTLEQGWALAPGASAGPIDGDALAALTALGYTPAEARGALGKVAGLDQLSLEEQIARALGRLGER